MKRSLWGIVSVLILLTACGGGGGDPEPAPEPAPEPEGNVSVTALRVLTDNLEISYPMSIEVEVESDVEGHDVSLSLFAIEKRDGADPEAETATDANVRQIPLGTELIRNVSNGGGPYQIEINIPASVEFPGAYYIVAVVDAADEQFETDEEDNTFSVEVNIAEPVDPNILIADLTLDRASLEISTLSYDDAVNAGIGDVYNADAGATLTIGSDGLKVNQTVDIEASAYLKITRTDISDSHDVALYLWNSDQRRYINAYGIDPSDGSSTAVERLPLGTFNPQLVTQGSEVDEVVEPEGVTLEDVGRNSTQMSYYFPGRLGGELAQAMRYNCVRTDIPVVLNASPATDFEPTLPPPDLTEDAINALKPILRNYPKAADCNVEQNETLAMDVTDFAICVEIFPADESINDRVEEDNEVCSPIAITLPPVEPTVPPALDIIGYTPQYLHQSAPMRNGVGFNTRGGGSVFAFGVNFGNYTSADHRGYVETVHASVPLTIFGTPLEFVGIDMRAQLVPDYEGKPEEDANTITMEIRHTGQVLTSWITFPPGEEPLPLTGVEVSVSEIDGEYSFSKEYPDSENGQFLEATFFVGPVPLSAGGYVTGTIGVRLGTVDQNLSPISYTSADDQYRLGMSIEPFAELDATMYGGFGSRRAIIAGVEGRLSLLSEALEFFYGIDIDLVNDGAGASPAEFVISQGPIITNTFTGPQGSINLFAEFPVIRFKKCKVGFIKIPCPKIIRVKVKKNLYTSPAAFEFVDILYEDPSLLLDVVLQDGEDPVYFVPVPDESE
jgi:hypothetical protein